jgi:hypothetical protein
MVAQPNSLRVIETTEPPVEPPYISVSAAGAILGVSERRMYDLLKVRVGPDPEDPKRSRPLIPHERSGDSYLIHRSEIVRYAREGRPDPWGEPTPIGERVLPEDRLAERVIARLIKALSAIQRDGALDEWR